MLSKNRIFGAVLIIFGLLVLLTPRYILPVCEYTGKPRMACTYMGHAEMLSGLVLIAAGLGAALTKGSIRWLMLVALVGSANVLALPSVIGYCKSAGMPCNYGSVPMLRFLGGLSAVVSVIGFAVSKER